MFKWEMIENFPYKVGDEIKINVPREVDWKVKKFEIVAIYDNYALLTDGVINVCYTLADLYYMKRGEVLKGEWN